MAGGGGGGRDLCWSQVFEWDASIRVGSAAMCDQHADAHAFARQGGVYQGGPPVELLDANTPPPSVAPGTLHADHFESPFVGVECLSAMMPGPLCGPKICSGALGTYPDTLGGQRKGGGEGGGGGESHKGKTSKSRYVHSAPKQWMCVPNGRMADRPKVT